jgi:photosystem II stability/assembly factor-like uncharacterized protein
VTLAGVALGDTNTGVAVGHCVFHPRPLQAFNLQVVLHTINGGRTWLFNEFAIGAGFLRAASFASPDTAIAVGDFMSPSAPEFGVSVLQTTDRGATWSRQSLFSQMNYTVHLYGVSYVDPLTATAVGDNTRFTLHGLIIRTVDGGASWMVQQAGTAVSLIGVSFIDANNGIAVGSEGTILRTSDGGDTWVSEDSGVTASLFGVSFVGSPCSL